MGLQVNYDLFKEKKNVFDFKEEIKELKIYINKIKEMHEINNLSIELDQWVIYENNLNTKRNIVFKNVKNKELKLSLKLFFLNEFKNNKSIVTIATRINYILDFIEATNEFNDTDEDFNDKIKRKFKKVYNDVFEFINYYPSINNYDYFYDYLNENINFEKIPNYKKIRELPPKESILDLDHVINDYFKNIDLKNNKEQLYYFPIYFWWNFTNIIPIRVSEFAHFKKDCLSIENGDYYLKLNRVFDKGSKDKKDIKIVDKIKINKELGEQLKIYEEISNKYPESETFLNYLLYKNELNDTSNGVLFEKTDIYNFNRNKLSLILNKFYENIVIGIYRKEAAIKVKLGDTRHFAFLNLMKNGYSPFEIARLGGHISVNTQYNYHNHQEFLLDDGVVECFKKFNVVEDSNDFLDFIFEEKTVISQEGKKLEIGSCYEENMKCPVDSCFDCPFWKIELNEFNDKKEVLLNEYKMQYNKSMVVIDSLIDLHNNFQNFSEENLNVKKEFERLSNEYKSGLIKLNNRAMIFKKEIGEFEN